MPWEDGPPPEAYERVTNPERFAAVVDAAKELIDELADRFDVERVDRPDGVRLVPRIEGAGALDVTFTDFPGVRVRMGWFTDEPYPDCGCDACDQQPVDEIEALRAVVTGFVTGGLTEEITRRWLVHELVYPGGRQGGRSRLLPGDRWVDGPRGRITWAPWPRS